MKTKFSVLAIIVLLAFGCATLNTGPSICDEIYDRSLICQLSARMGIKAEALSNLLIVATSFAIGSGTVNRTWALEGMTEIRALLDGDIMSYALFKTKVYGIIDRYPGLIDVAADVFSSFAQYQFNMYPEDINLIKIHLDKQIGILEG